MQVFGVVAKKLHQADVAYSHGNVKGGIPVYL
jgi:hypothetical protein